MRRLGLTALLLALPGCFQTLSFHCGADNARCGAGGMCVGGYCAFAAPACASGYRYDQSAGTLAGRCTEVPPDPVGPSPDLGPPPVVVTINGASNQTIYELDELTVTLTVSDPHASDLQLTATILPPGATFTSAGASGVLKWTPMLDDVGLYYVNLSAASASDPSQDTTQSFGITVKNAYDALLNPFSLSPDQILLSPIGDFDGDGIDDLAACNVAVDSANLPVYRVQILFGDPSGIPSARPYRNDRVTEISFKGDSGSTSTAGPVACVGGDFDGDGKSDVILTDYYYQAAVSKPPAEGAVWVQYGRERDDKTPRTAQLVLGIDDEASATAPIIGDWNGDGLADVAMFPNFLPPAGPTSLVHLNVWEGTSPRPLGRVTAHPIAMPRPCDLPAPMALGFVNPTGRKSFTGRSLQSIAVYDPALGMDGNIVTPPACGTSGGLRLMTPDHVGESRHFMPGVPRGNFFCDVDDDGFDDVVQLSWPDSSSMTLAIVYGGVDGWPTKPDLTTYTLTMATTFPVARCWKTAQGPGAIVVADEGDATDPGVVHLIGTRNRVPFIARDLYNPSGTSDTLGFGGTPVGPFDFNGDGREDFMFTANTRKGHAVPQVWIVYGR
jgi:hypothetical protein